MTDFLRRFERIVRKAHRFSQPLLGPPEEVIHPFDSRNIHPEIATVSQKLFDDGHYAQATFEAFKYLDKMVSKISGIKDSGHALMMSAFAEQTPKIQLTKMASTSEVDEQKGFKFIFGGVIWAIRNPRGHEVNMPDTIDQCLDHLSVASFLLRRLERRASP